MGSFLSFDNVNETVQRVGGIEMTLDGSEHERAFVNEILQELIEIKQQLFWNT